MAIERDERPWGSYEVLAESPGFKVKRIEVKPGQRLSLQSHEHRSEHWVVVRGRALVTVDDQQRELEANQHVLIPRGARHRVANVADDLLVFVEVQCGPYLGEDDIRRFEDDYNRAR